MKRLVIDARESGTSTGRYIDKLIEYLHKLDIRYEVILLCHANRVAYLNNIAPKFQTVETSYREFTFGEQFGLRKQIENLQPDLVHFGMIQQPVWYRGRVVTTMMDLTTARFQNPSKNPIVFTLKQQVYKWVTKRAAQKSDTVICISDYVRHDVAKYTGISLNKITVTHLAADKIPDHAEPVEALQGSEFIMYVGRPQPHKNLRRLIDTFVLLQSKHPKLKLALVGKKDALYEQHEKYVTEQRIKNVHFTGFASEAQLKWLYEHTACYVFPSLSEGFGLPALEAMTHGAPIASSNATCLPEIYGQAAVYFNPLSNKDMARAIESVITKNPNKIRTLGRRQANKYSWERTAKQTLNVYKKLLGS